MHTVGPLKVPRDTISDLISQASGEAVAITAPGRVPLSYQGLREQSLGTIESLNGLGVGRGDAVAVVLPNGPAMASSFVSIAAAATTAPLNPNYRRQEYESYLKDLDTKLLVVEEGSDSPALPAAHRLGIQIAYLTEGHAAGTFSLVGDPVRKQALQPGAARAEDVALVLHTSGTTSRPKIVPLTHRNVCASAEHIRVSLGLTTDDLCLNIMPLFHIHGLMAAVLSSLAAEATICCTPGFDALKFFTWMKEERPTWYTAVPTMHQAILGRGRRNLETIADVPLRFIRSSSASLPPQVMTQLEETFRAPVIEAYGMTEASHQMASNPLSPLARKPGTVGLAAGPEVSVMDEKDTLLTPGSIGEVVIRGPNVTSGYQNNPDANASSFVSGWFRTGDQGVIDSEGYLRLTGRLKEIINRGGEKISPREVDEVLMDHPSVAQVVTFSIPHPKLGEDVAAAIVLNDVEVSPEDIRQYARTHLADFKVPRKVVFLEEIPKGPTGKLQRIGLAERLNLI